MLSGNIKCASGLIFRDKHVYFWNKTSFPIFSGTTQYICRGKKPSRKVIVNSHKLVYVCTRPEKFSDTSGLKFR